MQACRARRMAVIFDEVMTGLYRIGALTAASLLREHPDIGCYAKLLTAGMSYQHAGRRALDPHAGLDLPLLSPQALYLLPPL